MDAFATIKQKLAVHPSGRPDRPELDQILRKLFTPEEAELARHLGFRAESAETISRVAGITPEEVADRCETMAKKGVALAVSRKSGRRYALLPMFPGIYEYPLMLGPRTGLDFEGLRSLWLKYFESVSGEEIPSNVPATRVLPINKTLDDDRTILPFEQVADYLDSARIIAVGSCPCRITARKCDRPIETCFYMNSSAEYLVEVGAAREVTKAEAMAIFHAAEDAGLVHIGSNAAAGGDVVCNCCPCCCIQLRDRIEGKGLGFGPASAYACTVDEASCTACGICIDRCPSNSIAVDSVAMINTTTCLGCGLCASACPSEAMKMVRRADAPEHLLSARDWAYQVAASKGHLEEFQRYLAPS